MEGNVMAENLIDFWQNCPLDTAPFVHPKDRDKLTEILSRKGRWAKNDAADFDLYITHPRFGMKDENHLHLSLLPVPYVGNLRAAEIVILLLNPGFSHCDYWAEHKVPEFRARLKQNLSQSFEGVEFPFHCLDPQFSWYTGFAWWEKKLQKTIHAIAEGKRWSYMKALQDISHRLACVELVPYHSASFGDHKLIDWLPSCSVAKSFVREQLLPDARAGKRTLIVTRQKDSWGLKEEANVIVYKDGEERGASLTPNSRGGEAILRAYGLNRPFPLRPSRISAFRG